MLLLCREVSGRDNSCGFLIQLVSFHTSVRFRNEGNLCKYEKNNNIRCVWNTKWEWREDKTMRWESENHFNHEMESK